MTCHSHHVTQLHLSSLLHVLFTPHVTAIKTYTPVIINYAQIPLKPITLCILFHQIAVHPHLETDLSQLFQGQENLLSLCYSLSRKESVDN